MRRACFLFFSFSLKKKMFFSPHNCRPVLSTGHSFLSLLSWAILFFHIFQTPSSLFFRPQQGDPSFFSLEFFLIFFQKWKHDQKPKRVGVVARCDLHFLPYSPLAYFFFFPYSILQRGVMYSIQKINKNGTGVFFFSKLSGLRFRMQSSKKKYVNLTN